MKNRLGLYGLMVFITGVMVACSIDKYSKTITFVYSNKVNYEPFIIADELGYFREAGLDIRTKLVVGGIHAAEALATGSADGAAMGDAPAIILISRNPSVKIVARYGEGEKIHRLIVNHQIIHPKDLEGKRIGIQVGSSTHGGFLLWAESHRLDIGLLRIIPLHPFDMPEAMHTHQIDAIAGSEPWPTHVENLCGNRVHQLDDFSGLGHTFPHVLVVTDRIISSHPDVVPRMLRATNMAIRYLKENPDQAAVITAKHIGISLEDQKVCTSRLNWQIGWDRRDVESMRITSTYLKRFQKIQEIPDLEKHLAIQEVD